MQTGWRGWVRKHRCGWHTFPIPSKMPGSLWWEEAGAYSDNCSWFENVENYQELLSVISKPRHPSAGVFSSLSCVSSLFMEELSLVTLCTCLRQENKSRRTDATTVWLGQSKRLLLHHSSQLPGQLPRSLAAHLPFTYVHTQTGQWSRSVSIGHPWKYELSSKHFSWEEPAMLKMNKAKVSALTEFIGWA